MDTLGGRRGSGASLGFFKSHERGNGEATEGVSWIKKKEKTIDWLVGFSPNVDTTSVPKPPSAVVKLNPSSVIGPSDTSDPVRWTTIRKGPARKAWCGQIEGQKRRGMVALGTKMRDAETRRHRARMPDRSKCWRRAARDERHGESGETEKAMACSH